MRTLLPLLVVVLGCLGCAKASKTSQPISIHSGEVAARQATVGGDMAQRLNKAKVFQKPLDASAANPKPKTVNPVVEAPQKKPGDEVDIESLLAEGRVNIVAFEADW